MFPLQNLARKELSANHVHNPVYLVYSSINLGWGITKCKLYA